jgi:hypothetical protein
MPLVPRPRRTVLLAILTGVAVAALAWASIPATPSATVRGIGGWTQSASGPVGPNDRAFLVALRQASLWEVPVSQQAELLAASPGLRAATTGLATDLSGLDGQVREAAGALGVMLPDQPSAAQQTWATEIAGESGTGYDRTVAEYLRDDCAALLGQARQVRRTTGNARVREVAEKAERLLGARLATLPEFGSGLGPKAGLLALAAVLLIGGATRGVRRSEL